MTDVPRLTALPPDLAANDVHLFIAPTDLSAAPPEILLHFESLLSDDERQKIARLRIAAKRTESLISRGMLRHLLSHVLHIAPRDLIFDANAHGKPFLKDYPLHFNISHTPGVVILAMARDHELGIDIERVHDLSFEELAERYFAPSEHRALLAIPSQDRLHAFFRCWTRKESLLKVTGLGISSGLHRFQVPLHDSTDPLCVNQWRLHDVKVSSIFIASLAVASANAQLRYWCYKMGTVQPG